MKKIFFLICIAILGLPFSGQTQGFKRLYKAGLSSAQSIEATLATSDGGYLLFVSASSGKNFFYLVKTDPQGDTLWIRKHTKILPTTLFSSKLALLPNGNYALTLIASKYTTEPTRLMLFNPAGRLLKQRDFLGNSVSCAIGDGFFVAEWLKSTNMHTVHRLDGELNTLWQNSFAIGATGNKHLLDMLTTHDGGACIYTTIDSTTGSQRPQLIKVSATGAPEWQRMYYELSNINTGNLLLAPNGDFILNNRNESQYYSLITRTDSKGNIIWLRQLDFGFPFMCLMPSGNIAFCGYPLSATSKWLLYNMNGDGDPLDLKVLSYNQYQGQGKCIINTPDGGLLMSGLIYSNLISLALIKTDAEGNAFPHFFKGKVQYDLDHSCTSSPTDKALGGWLVTATAADGSGAAARTAPDGSYEMNLPAGAYTLQAHLPGDLWQTCDNSTLEHTFSGNADTLVQDFRVQDALTCPLLDVSVATGALRPCRDTRYVVSWCNQGTSKAIDARLAVLLPPGLDFISATRSAEISGDTLWFRLGDVDYLTCGELRIDAYVNCAVVQTGQTLCAKAYIFPDTLCQQYENWSGARVVADARCVGDSLVEFSLSNRGSAPTTQLRYLVTENYLAGPGSLFELGPGETLLVQRPANGSTQRIEARQEPGYPYPSLPSAAIEGCGGWNSLGLINQFPQDDAGPFVDIDCREVTSSLDPNDKQGFPGGYSTDHWVEPETELTYLIRFQNTGTDTAFYVEVRDTLSAWLDPATLRIGAASHPFSWKMYGENALSFRFADILLPDSSTNEPGSQGFVQFRVRPKTDAPLGLRIENSASIYFDFNAPVVTNRTQHRLGRDFYIVTMVDAPGVPALPVRVQPNPFREQARFLLPADAAGDYQFRLYDAGGRLLQAADFSGTEYELPAAGLQQGYYWFELLDARRKAVARGKIVRQ